MWQWLRSWFAWRFSLTRLVIAVVFLGAFVGLNMRKIGPLDGEAFRPTEYWGWPFPVVWSATPLPENLPDDFTEEEFKEAERRLAAFETSASYRLPLTHKTYRFLEFRSFRWDGPEWDTFLILVTPQRDASISVSLVMIDALVLLVPLSLILFYHPRRKPEPEPETAP